MFFIVSAAPAPVTNGGAGVLTPSLASDMSSLSLDPSGYSAVSYNCLLYTSPSPRDKRQSRMPSSA